MSPCVLIVEDDKMISTNLAGFLFDEGMDVTVVGSGEEAVSLVQSGQRFDVCVLDMRLPGIDGNETANQLHELASELKFIVHTGSASYSLPSRLKASIIRMEHVFRKPVQDMQCIADATRELYDEQRGAMSV